MWLFYVIGVFLIFFLMDKYYPKYKPKKEKEINTKRVVNSNKNNSSMNSKNDEKLAIFINQFVYEYMYNNFINKKDKNYSVYRDEYKNFEKTFFLKEFIKYINIKDVKAYFPSGHGDCVFFEEFNLYMFCRFNAEIDWKTEYKTYQFNFGLSNKIINTARSIIDSVIVLLDKDDIIRDITVIEKSDIGIIPVVKKLTPNGDKRLLSEFYIESGFEMEISNFTIHNEQFNEALIRYYYETGIINSY